MASFMILFILQNLFIVIFLSFILRKLFYGTSEMEIARYDIFYAVSILSICLNVVFCAAENAEEANYSKATATYEFVIDKISEDEEGRYVIYNKKKIHLKEDISQYIKKGAKVNLTEKIYLPITNYYCWTRYKMKKKQYSEYSFNSIEIGGLEVEAK